MPQQPTPIAVSRALSILELFDATHPSWSVEAMAEKLGCSVPTSYRYVKELLTTGLLRRLPGAQLALGPRILRLDYAMRQADPLLGAAIPIMRDLTIETGCDCVLTSLFGEEFVDLHHQPGPQPLALSYGRGRPRPAFRGAAPKIILSQQPTAYLRKFLATRLPEAFEAGLGATVDDVRASLRAIRKRGVYVSQGELEPDIDAIAVPLTLPAIESLAALALVDRHERFTLMNEPSLRTRLHTAAARIRQTLTPAAP
jgi:DNA-binding IclR family transcriptional regulator